MAKKEVRNEDIVLSLFIVSLSFARIFLHSPDSMQRRKKMLLGKWNKRMDRVLQKWRVGFDSVFH
jgi:hypothetical protein